jgi:hypothetical protein
MYVTEACQVQFHAVFTSAIDGLSRSHNYGHFTATVKIADTQSVGGKLGPDSVWK